MTNIVEIKNLNNGDNISDFSLNIKLGSFSTILSSNSIVKDYLIDYLSAKKVPKSYVKICGVFLNSKNIKEIRKHVLILGENPDNFFICNTVLEDINFFLKHNGLSDLEITSKINNFVRDFDVEKILNLSPTLLSCGQKQLIAIFLATSVKTDLLVLDNATTMLDFNTKEKVYDILHKLNKNKTTIINFTNDSEDILKGVEVILLKDNKIIIQTPVKNMLNDVKIFTDNSIRLPFIIELSDKLSYYNIINKSYTDITKLVNDLWK